MYGKHIEQKLKDCRLQIFKIVLTQKVAIANVVGRPEGVVLGSEGGEDDQDGGEKSGHDGHHHQADRTER